MPSRPSHEPHNRGAARRPHRNLLCLLVGLLAGWLLPAPVNAGNLVIVMDDLGYNLARAERILALPAPVTMAVLPFAPHSAEVARRALAAGRDVILHQPMEAFPGAHVRPAPGTLTAAMTPGEFATQFEAALAAVPGIIAVNNHKGSRLTEDPETMQRLMSHLAARELAFLDSRTTPRSVAYRTARDAQLPSMQRDVFLDHVATYGAVKAAFQYALRVAGERGYAVVIGHPHEVTISFLEETLPILPAGFQVVSFSSELLRPHRMQPDPPADPEYLRKSPAR
jgi:polysaccharide deacetylase 2 family uncharacterized protein YibQ